MSASKRFSFWIPALCLMVVLLQWAVWSQVGLNISPSLVAEIAVPAEDARRVLQTGLGDTTVNAFDQVIDSKFRTADLSDLCYQLRDWPLPGCTVG